MIPRRQKIQGLAAFSRRVLSIRPQFLIPGLYFGAPGKRRSVSSSFLSPGFPNAHKTKPSKEKLSRVLKGEPDSDLLSPEIQPTIIGARAFHRPVRNGKGWGHSAMAVRQRLCFRSFLRTSQANSLGRNEITWLAFPHSHISFFLQASFQNHLLSFN